MLDFLPLEVYGESSEPKNLGVIIFGFQDGKWGQSGFIFFLIIIGSEHLAHDRWSMRPRDLRESTFLIQLRIQVFSSFQGEPWVPVWNRFQANSRMDPGPHKDTITKTFSWAASTADGKQRGGAQALLPCCSVFHLPLFLESPWGWGRRLNSTLGSPSCTVCAQLVLMPD